MARPATIKMPVTKTLMSEVLQRVSNAKVKDEKIAVLKEYETEALKKLLLCNFSKSISFVFPLGQTPYNEVDMPIGVNHQLFMTEHRLLDLFIAKDINGVTYYGCSNTPQPRIQQLKKESMWIQLLENLHKDEAEVLDLVKDKKLTSRYKITKQIVIEAFPQLGLQNEDT